MLPPLRDFSIQHIHQDQVQRLPVGGVLLARSDHCEVGMFRVGESMLGIEGHPEFTVPYGEALIRARRDRIGAQRAQAALDSLQCKTDQSAIGGWIAQFIRSVRRGSRSA